MTPDYWKEAKKHLKKSCPVMKRIIDGYPGELMQGRGDAFYTLMRSIVGQQISVKAADAVWAKLEAKVTPLTPEKILRVRATTLRACGFSGQKVEYAKNLARFFVDKKVGGGEETRGDPRDRPRSEGGQRALHASLHLSPMATGRRSLRAPHKNYWAALPDDAIIAELTSIKGIGRWTAEMFLMFHLQRPDVFPLQDLGMIKALEKHYAHGAKLSKSEILAHGERFRPYRSVATWYLWRSLDPVPVGY